MKEFSLKLLFIFIACMMQQSVFTAVAQEQGLRGAIKPLDTADSTKSGTAGSVLDRNNSSPPLTGERHPQYRLCKNDVIAVTFTFAPEFDQTVTIQPDGFIELTGLPDIHVEGVTVAELRQAIRQAYTPILHDPEITITLKDYDRPSFIASGQVMHPGKFELRSDITVTEAVAIAGGFTEQAKHSQVVLFRRISAQIVEAHVLDIKFLLQSRNLNEDMHMQVGDLIFVPQNRISKIRKYLPMSNLSAYVSPSQF
ncbi:MAG TPA: polysaccharide biosynthesis/export family protein [Terriglobales bacterium]|nr:polysaccharide biosynthesis/export family protein [Terriglobales bacterium]